MDAEQAFRDAAEAAEDLDRRLKARDRLGDHDLFLGMVLMIFMAVLHVGAGLGMTLGHDMSGLASWCWGMVGGGWCWAALIAWGQWYEDRG